MKLDPKNIDSREGYYKALDEFYVYADDENDKFIYKSLRETGEWEPDTTSFLLQTIKPGWKCLDIGSHNGYFTEVMSRCSGPTGSVISFEPRKKLIDLYEKGKFLNDYSKSAPITMHNFGLSNKTRDTFVRVSDFNSGASYILDNPNSESSNGSIKFHDEPVEVKRLDEVYDETPDIIKLDAEGHEKEIFEGFSKNTLECPLIVLEIGRPYSISFLNYLNKNYNLYNFMGIKTETYNILGEDLVNIVLRKK